MLFWCLILHQKGPEGPAMSAPRNRERAPTGHRASNCLLSTNEMTHFGNDCLLLKTPVLSLSLWISKMVISLVTFSLTGMLFWHVVPTSTGARGPGRVCLPEPGTGTDGSPNLKPPKWLSCFDLGIPLSFGSRLEIGYVASMVHSIFIKRFTKARQNKRKILKGTEAKGLPRHVIKILTDPSLISFTWQYVHWRHGTRRQTVHENGRLLRLLLVEANQISCEIAYVEGHNLLWKKCSGIRLEVGKDLLSSFSWC